MIPIFLSHKTICCLILALLSLLGTYAAHEQQQQSAIPTHKSVRVGGMAQALQSHP